MKPALSQKVKFVDTLRIEVHGGPGGGGASKLFVRSGKMQWLIAAAVSGYIVCYCMVNYNAENPSGHGSTRDTAGFPDTRHGTCMSKL